MRCVVQSWRDISVHPELVSYALAKCVLCCQDSIGLETYVMTYTNMVSPTFPQGDHIIVFMQCLRCYHLRSFLQDLVPAPLLDTCAAGMQGLGRCHGVVSSLCKQISRANLGDSENSCSKVIPMTCVRSAQGSGGHQSVQFLSMC